jgi:hypothetical protein
MFTKMNHKGVAVLEFIPLGAIVITVVIIILYTIAKNGGASGTSLGTWSGGC